MTKEKPFTKMDAAELADATAEFDREGVIDEFRPLDEAAKVQWRRARRRRGRPRQGAGAKVISVSIERGLLEQADQLAKREGVSRANLVARGLRAVLAIQDAA